MQECVVGTVVEQFVGPLVEYEQITDYDRRYVLAVQREGKWRWLLPLSNARYADHSCQPSCALDDQLRVVLVRNVQAGQPLTFLYNHGHETDEWDPLWSFSCQCGSPICQGIPSHNSYLYLIYLPVSFLSHCECESRND
jgi:hypothetical protein